MSFLTETAGMFPAPLCGALNHHARKRKDMDNTLIQIALCVERGKINKDSPYPPDLKGQLGADEWTKQAIEEGVTPDVILAEGLIVGMQHIGEKFRQNKVFLPEVLMAAKSMMTAMGHIKPFLESGQVKQKGVFVVGTVAGDLHEIGKNIVAMIVRGSGWQVVDLGFDVSAEKFFDAIQKYPGCVVGLSALLTTTMESMAATASAIKTSFPRTKIVVGGAPITQKFANSIGADGYSPDPQGAVEFLNSLSLVL